MADEKRKQNYVIANALINAKLLTKLQLDRVEQLSQKSGMSPQVLLIDMALITEKDLLTTYEAVSGLRAQTPSLKAVDADSEQRRIG